MSGIERKYRRMQERVAARREWREWRRAWVEGIRERRAARVEVGDVEYAVLPRPKLRGRITAVAVERGV